MPAAGLGSPQNWGSGGERGQSFLLNDAGRKQVIVAYQKRKQLEVDHPLLKQSAPLGLFPHLQARVLARHLRGDLPSYVPFIPR